VSRFAGNPLKTPGHRDMSVLQDRDPTCPECRGKCQDAHGFDCRRCAGEGVVDE